RHRQPHAEPIEGQEIDKEHYAVQCRETYRDNVNKGRPEIEHHRGAYELGSNGQPLEGQKNKNRHQESPSERQSLATENFVVRQRCGEKQFDSTGAAGFGKEAAGLNGEYQLEQEGEWI